jgi:signal transduction histidine kinase
VHNLLDNAAKYSPPGSPIRLAATAHGQEARIEVADHGAGIPDGERKKIFQAFYRGAGARDQGVKGTGIGLAMAREIVNAHGGRITLESSPETGTRFAIILPVNGGKEREWRTS